MNPSVRPSVLSASDSHLDDNKIKSYQTAAQEVDAVSSSDDGNKKNKGMAGLMEIDDLDESDAEF